MAARAGYTALTPETTTFPPRFVSAPVPNGPEAIQRRTASKSNPFHSLTANGSLRRYSDGLRGFVDNNAGLLLVALAQLFFAFVNVSIKVLKNTNTPISTFQVVLIRMSVTYVCCIAFMLWKNVPDPFLGPEGIRLLLVFRGFIGFFGLFGVYYSLRYLSLSDATALTFLTPIFTGIASAIFLKEPLSKKELLAGLFSFAGVLLIARPEFLFGAHAHASSDESSSMRATPQQRLIAVGVALIGVLGQTGAYTSIRAIGKRAHPLHSLAFFASQSCVVAAIGMAVTHEKLLIPLRWDFWGLFVIVGVGGFLAQTLFTMGLQREAAGRATLAIYVGVIFAIAFEKICFGTSPSALSVVGMTIILSCALYVALTKAKPEPKKASPEDSALEQGLLSADDDADEHELDAIEVRKSPRATTNKLPSD